MFLVCEMCCCLMLVVFWFGDVLVILLCFLGFGCWCVMYFS